MQPGSRWERALIAAILGIFSIGLFLATSVPLIMSGLLLEKYEPELWPLAVYFGILLPPAVIGGAACAVGQGCSLRSAVLLSSTVMPLALVLNWLCPPNQDADGVRWVSSWLVLGGFLCLALAIQREAMITRRRVAANLLAFAGILAGWMLLITLFYDGTLELLMPLAWIILPAAVQLFDRRPMPRNQPLATY